jgi:glutamate/aspartate transport system substrate-binding protein
MIVLVSLWLLSGASVAEELAGPPDTLARIARTGVVRIGYIPTPGTFAFQDATGETRGYSIELCMKVLANIRQALRRPDLRAQFRPLAPADRIPLLKSGAIDMDCGGNTNTVVRQRDVDFSYTFFTTGVRFLVKRPFEVAGTSSLWKKTVAVTNGTTAQDVLMRLKLEQDIQVISVASDAEGVRLVETANADAFAQDDVLLYGLLASSPIKDQLAVSGAFMTVEPYAFMLPKHDAALRSLVDKTLAGLMQSGEIVSIYRKWFDSDRLRIPMNVYMQENLRFPNRYGVP